MLRDSGTGWGMGMNSLSRDEDICARMCVFWTCVCARMFGVEQRIRRRYGDFHLVLEWGVCLHAELSIHALNPGSGIKPSVHEAQKCVSLYTERYNLDAVNLHLRMYHDNKYSKDR